jgi:hypothetical protein
MMTARSPSILALATEANSLLEPICRRELNIRYPSLRLSLSPESRVHDPGPAWAPAAPAGRGTGSLRPSGPLG